MTSEDSAAIDAYIKSYTEQIDKRLRMLEATFERVTGYRPAWDPMSQDFMFLMPDGSAVMRPLYPSRANMEKRLFPWFTGKNSKKK
jgi:hypothetical protein